MASIKANLKGDLPIGKKPAAEAPRESDCFS